MTGLFTASHDELQALDVTAFNTVPPLVSYTCTLLVPWEKLAFYYYRITNNTSTVVYSPAPCAFIRFALKLHSSTPLHITASSCCARSLLGRYEEIKHKTSRACEQLPAERGAVIFLKPWKVPRIHKPRAPGLVFLLCPSSFI